MDQAILIYIFLQFVLELVVIFFSQIQEDFGQGFLD
jgi:hypothetical protein